MKRAPDYTLNCKLGAFTSPLIAELKERIVDLNLARAAARLENVIYSFSSFPVNLENGIYVTISTPKSHEGRKAAKENFSTNYRQEILF